MPVHSEIEIHFKNFLFNRQQIFTCTIILRYQEFILIRTFIANFQNNGKQPLCYNYAKLKFLVVYLSGSIRNKPKYLVAFDLDFKELP